MNGTGASTLTSSSPVDRNERCDAGAMADASPHRPATAVPPVDVVVVVVTPTPPAAPALRPLSTPPPLSPRPPLPPPDRDAHNACVWTAVASRCWYGSRARLLLLPAPGTPLRAGESTSLLLLLLLLLRALADVNRRVDAMGDTVGVRGTSTALAPASRMRGTEGGPCNSSDARSDGAAAVLLDVARTEDDGGAGDVGGQGSAPAGTPVHPLGRGGVASPTNRRPGVDGA